ncbi:hypothetical protein BCL80_1214 [Streptomyces avidinii]|nr:hypothetical protein [Streptomyces pratensis]RAS22511.1 hypothetical protein BCL80_1214 [Streptomyces avidinii]
MLASLPVLGIFASTPQAISGAEVCRGDATLVGASESNAGRLGTAWGKAIVAAAGPGRICPLDLTPVFPEGHKPARILKAGENRMDSAGGKTSRLRELEAVTGLGRALQEGSQNELRLERHTQRFRHARSLVWQPPAHQ